MIFCCQDPRQGHLPLDGVPEALRKGHDATFVAFGLINVEAVFSYEAHGFWDSHNPECFPYNRFSTNGVMAAQAVHAVDRADQNR